MVNVGIKMYRKISLLILVTLHSAGVVADSADKESADVIVISSERVRDDLTLAESNEVSADVASWLKSVPGANVNRNGLLTGVAQYRGMFGDRISKSIGGRTIISAGPNAMDSPLSYASPVNIDSMVVYRGIAPVVSGIDSIGGAVDVQLQRAKVMSNGGAGVTYDGSILTHYADNNEAKHVAADFSLSNNAFGLYLYGNDQQAKNYIDAEGNEIRTSSYERQSYGIDMAFAVGASEFGISANRVDTDNTGTPALPMDINYIEGDDVSVRGQHSVSDGTLSWQLGIMENTHGMDNFSQRMNMMPAMHRYTYAEADSADYHLEYLTDDWRFGIDGTIAEHSVIISNPNNPMFEVANFNKVQDNRHSVFAQWEPESDSLMHSLGLRVKYNLADADNVHSSMAMMMPAVMGLQNDFNQADKSVSDTTFDLVYRGSKEHNQNLSWIYGAAVKQKAASYQQRYLWLPMQATGGLADGKTYVGNINLDPETAYQLEAGFEYVEGGFSASPRFFYYSIKDYIEANPSQDARVIMAAQMMGDPTPLQFNNIDATLYGFDANWLYHFQSDFYLAGTISYVRGDRNDTDDKLYRIAPLNTNFVWGYDNGRFSNQFKAEIYASQNRVSALNNEPKSSGYMVWHWQADYYFDGGVRLKAGIENMFDKTYSEHLGGVNRAMGSDIAVNERLPALGRNLYMGLEYRF